MTHPAYELATSGNTHDVWSVSFDSPEHHWVRIGGAIRAAERLGHHVAVQEWRNGMGQIHGITVTIERKVGK